MTMAEKIHAVLRLIPAPFVKEASDAVFAVIETVHEAHETAHKDEATPPTLEDWRAAVNEAAADAAEPWKRIRDKAKAETTSAEKLGHPHGSFGE